VTISPPTCQRDPEAVALNAVTEQKLWIDAPNREVKRSLLFNREVECSLLFVAPVQETPALDAEGPLAARRGRVFLERGGRGGEGEAGRRDHVGGEEEGAGAATALSALAGLTLSPFSFRLLDECVLEGRGLTAFIKS